MGPNSNNGGSGTIEDLLEKLETAGWLFGGGINPETGNIGLGLSIDPDSGRSFSEEDFKAKLSILDDEGELIEGFKVGTEENGPAFVEYEGPVDARFARFVVEASTLLITEE